MRNDVSMVKNYMEKIVGSKVVLEVGKGKQKATTTFGIIEKVYPSIFIIQLYDDKKPKNKVTYSYTDILTRAVELTLYE